MTTQQLRKKVGDTLSHQEPSDLGPFESIDVVSLSRLDNLFVDLLKSDKFGVHVSELDKANSVSVNFVQGPIGGRMEDKKMHSAEILLPCSQVLYYYLSIEPVQLFVYPPSEEVRLSLVNGGPTIRWEEGEVVNVCRADTYQKAEYEWSDDQKRFFLRYL